MASISDNTIEDKRLLARIEDAVEAAYSGQGSRFVGFLDERQAALVKAWADRHARHVSWRLFGGHVDAERVFFGVFADYDEPLDDMFPVTPIGFYYREQASLSHRDILGSLMGCGIVRDKIGDILCADGLAVVFVKSELADYITSQVVKIGREGVKTQCPFVGDLPAMHTFKPISGTVASARLDAVLKVLLGVSREQAVELIRMSLVSVNHQLCSSVSMSLREGDLLSVRGRGRFVIDDLSETSSKGRVIVKARKYV